jgi:PKD repeat protein
MNIKYPLVLWILICLCSITAIAQSPCVSDEVSNALIHSQEVDHAAKNAIRASVTYWRKHNPGPYSIPSPGQSGEGQALVGNPNCPEVKYVIPVVVHVVHDTGLSVGQSENISTSQIENQLEALNDAFKNDHGMSINTGIQFELAKVRPDGTSFSGIERHESILYRNVSLRPSSYDSLFAAFNFDEDSYLNIYVVHQIQDSFNNPSAAIGFATYPYTKGFFNQGVVVEYDVFGTSSFGSPIGTGREGEVLVHEMGHFLGLFHPWEQGCRGSNQPDCATQGDMCCDVPQSSQIQTTCGTYNTCIDNPDHDAVMNYMFYSPESCRNEFTEDQVGIMHSTLEQQRRFLATPNNVNSKNGDLCVWSAIFRGPFLMCENDTIQYTAYDLGSSFDYRWFFRRVGGSTTTRSDDFQVELSGLSIGEYDVWLEISNSTDTISDTLRNRLEVVKCNPLKDTKANWLFGDHAGIQFRENGSPIRTIGPREEEPNIRSHEGSASISDSSGNLEFYVGGRRALDSAEFNDLTVFGSNFLPITNDTINGSSSSAQSSLIVPYYNDSNQFHIITRSRPVSTTSGNPFNEFSHHVVDVSKISTFPLLALGEVTSANQTIQDSQNNPPGFSESLTAIKRCSDTSYWLITADQDNKTLEFYTLDNTGPEYDHRDTIFVSPQLTVGFIKFSPDGNWVWALNSLYRFCREDGDLQLVFNDSLDNFKQIYGVSFSPNSKFLYTTSAEYSGSGSTTPNDTSFIHTLNQFDLYSNDVESSEVHVQELDNQEFENYFRSLQIGPDEKIYVSAYGQPQIGVIHKPNVRASTLNECEFSPEGPILSVGGDGGLSSAGLPNFIDARGPDEILEGFNVINLACLQKEFLPETCCSDSYKWLFGTGDSSEAKSPTYTFDNAGTYAVTLIVGTDTFSKEVEIGSPVNNIAIFGSQVICFDSFLAEYSTIRSKDYDYLWSVEGGSFTQGGLGERIDVVWTDSGIVRLTVTDRVTGCIGKDSLPVWDRDSIDLNFWASTSNCSEFQFTTLNYCDESYFWDFGDGSTDTIQNPIHQFSDTGQYTVTLIVGTDTATKIIQVGIGGQDLIISGADENCSDSTLFSYSLPLKNTFQYDWSAQGSSQFTTNQNTADVIWQQSGFLSVVVTDTVSGCKDTAFLEVKKLRPDSIDFTFAVSNCTEVSFFTESYCGLDKHWQFGDGDTSILEDPVHNYLERGIYTVTLCVDGDTITKEIVADRDVIPEIEGVSTICDTSLEYDYTLNNHTENDQFDWFTFNGITLLNDSLNAQFKFFDSTQIGVVITNPIGCIDTVLKDIYLFDQISNNTISASQNYFCNLDSSSVITGLTPTGGPGNYTYKWYEKFAGNDTLYLLESDTGLNYYFSDSIVEERDYVRLTSSGECEAYSNYVHLIFVLEDNVIEILDTPCFSGDTINLIANGNQFYSQGGADFDWLWQKSTDSVSWSRVDSTGSYSSPKTYQYSTTSNDETSFFRRLVRGNDNPFSCNEYSNVITVKHKIRITEQPRDWSICDPVQDSFYYDIGIDNQSGGSITITAQYKSDGGSSFSDIATGSSVHKPAILPSGYTGTDTVRFKITSDCGTFFSDKVLLIMASSSPQINGSFGPYNQYGNVGDSKLLSVLSTGVTTRYKWQIKNIDNPDWTDIQWAESSDLVYKSKDVCDGDAQFRAIAINGCGADTSGTANFYLIDDSDIWFRDSPKDTGAEPNPDSSHFDIVKSPDIWNRLTDDNGIEHLDPEYKALSSNYLYIKVRNKGSDTTQTTPLKLYWTFASTNGEIWDWAWLDTSRNLRYNSDSAKYFPMGSKIDKDDLFVPPILPGDSFTVSYPWNPPSPNWYKINGSYDSSINVCLLARLEHCQTYPHKMGIDEQFNTHVKRNAINNNNIITKNLWVYNRVDTDFADHDSIWTPWTTVGIPDEPTETLVPFKPCIEEIHPDFFDKWEVRLQVDSVLKDAIISASSSNPHIIYDGNNIFSFASWVDPCISDVNVPAKGNHFFRLEFIPIGDYTLFPHDNYEVGVAQYNNESPDAVGAVIFSIDNTKGIFNNLAYTYQGEEPEETASLLLSPNPTNGSFSVELDALAKSQMSGHSGTIVVADNYGIPHIVLTGVGASEKRTISLSGYKAGVYNVRFEIGGEVFYKYLVLEDQ